MNVETLSANGVALQSNSGYVDYELDRRVSRLELTVYGNETDTAPGIKARVDRIDSYGRTILWLLGTGIPTIVTLLGYLASKK